MIVLATAVGTVEYFQLIRSREYHPFTFLGLIVALTILLAAYNKRLELLPLLIVAAFMLTAILHLLRWEQKNFGMKVGATLVGCIYVSLPFSMLMMIVLQPDIAAPALVFVVLVTWASDIGAYTIGSLFGRHKLAPRISPGKTIEGSIGGIIFSLLVAVLLGIFWPEMDAVAPLEWGIGLAILFSVIGQAGDLVESALKRDHGVKDSGLDLTGHGGLLDIIDSLIFTAPIMYLYLIFRFPNLHWF